MSVGNFSHKASKSKVEEWRDVPGYEGLYQVSNMGRIKSLPRIVPMKDGPRSCYKNRMYRVGEKLIRPRAIKGSYCRIVLSHCGVEQGWGVHQLVLTAFIGKCPEGMQCRHLNGDKYDNRLENLCWGTARQNARDRVIHGTTNLGKKGATHKLTGKTEELRQLYATGLYTKRQLALKYGVKEWAIGAHLHPSFVPKRKVKQYG